MENKKNRYGRIKISEENYKTFWNEFQNCIIPYRIEFLYAERCFIIEADCAYFEETKEGDLIPDYIFKNESCIEKIEKCI